MDIFGEVWNNYLDEISAFWEKNISDDDVVLIAGDISWAMTLENVKPDLEYISKFDGSPFTELFEQFNVKTVVYGHLHGKNVRARLNLQKNGVDYYLTSCDMIGNTPVEITIDKE